MTTTWWAGAPGADVVPDVHLLAAVDAALAGSGAEAELVCTHVDRSAPAPRVGISVRLRGEPADPAATRGALAHALAGPVLTDDGADDGADGGADQTDAAPARTALAEARAGSAGRAVRFPGSAAVTGRVPVADLLATTAIEHVTGVGVQVTGAEVVDTGDSGFLRPTWLGGRLTLVVEQAAGDVLQPFEIESPHECCGGGH